MMRKLVILLIILSIIALPGCWDFREIQNHFLIVGIAIDPHSGSEDLMVSARIPVPSSNLQEASTLMQEAKIVTRSGKTVLTALEKMGKELKKKLYIGHLQIVVINEQIAKTHMKNIIDTLSRNPQIQRHVYLLITSGEARNVISASSSLDTAPMTDLRNMFDVNVSNSFIPTTLDNFLLDVESHDADPAIPIITTNNNTISVEGMALFNGFDMVGTINGEETRFLSLLPYQKHTEEYYLVRGQYYNKNPQDVFSIRIANKKSSIKVFLKEGRITAQVHIKLWGVIAEYPERPTGTSDEEIYHFAGKQLEELLEKNGNNLIKKTKKYNTDILRIGKYVRAKYPTYWDQIDWREEYKKVDFDIHIEAVVHSAYTSKLTRQ
ncbi:Ger(x)C family spore germination protein [Geosporobacter ferrireducens]|nr:Ger(x)C family spore germination protein [Geosporobacter ferrireducens]